MQRNPADDTSRRHQDISMTPFQIIKERGGMLKIRSLDLKTVGWIPRQVWNNTNQQEEPMSPTQRDLSNVPSYVGTKIVKAEPMTECQFLSSVKGEDTTHREDRPGYIVHYPDGYTSWSPKATFERAYRQLTPEESRMAHWENK